VRIGILVFPGSNCDYDMYRALRDQLGAEADYVWHQTRRLSGYDALVVPGGFSYGDYLRAGAIARFAPAMEAVREFAHAGGPVIGICNGFQILLEAGLLPGAMLRNRHLAFLCQWVHVRVENAETPLTFGLKRGQILKIPIAHKEGNYHTTPEMLQDLERKGQVVFRYCDPDGALSEAANPNGSLAAIAGIANQRGNVVALMPHPERAVEACLGSSDGLILLRALQGWVRRRQSC
jgi:phosphoribosylformylglycinamidine synthase I